MKGFYSIVIERGDKSEAAEMGEGEASGDFKTGLFSCFSDKTLCLMSFTLPNYVFGRLAEMVLMEHDNYYMGVLKYQVVLWL